MSGGRQLASQSALIFAARLTGAGIVFLAQAAIARTLGAEALGRYLLVMAAVNIIAMVLPLGFETTGTYFAAEYRARGDGRLLRGFLLRAYGHVAAIGLLFGLFGAPLVGRLGAGGAVLAAHWPAVSLLSVATSLIYVNGAVLVGLKRPFAGYFAEALVKPLVIVAALVLALLWLPGGERLGGLLGALAVLYALVAAGHFLIVAATARRLPAEAEQRPGEWRRWWRFALPWVLIALATDYFFDIDLMLLANLMDAQELAIFGVITRIFALVSFAIVAVYSVTMPDLFESEVKRERDGLRRRLGEANLVASGLALGLFLVSSGLGPVALMLYGPGFEAGAAPLAVLCLSLIVRAVAGPANLVLSVHDRPHMTLPAIGLGLVTLIGANLLLVPRFGLMGASVSALLAITLWSAALWLTVRLVTGLDVSLLAAFAGRRGQRPVAAR